MQHELHLKCLIAMENKKGFIAAILLHITGTMLEYCTFHSSFR